VLSDQSTLAKQVDQLAELQTRREQLEMMIEWRAELAKLDDSVVDRLAAHWSDLCEGTVSLTPTGTDKLRRALKDFGLDHTTVAMEKRYGAMRGATRNTSTPRRASTWRSI
jgi:hypothetical protein